MFIRTNVDMIINVDNIDHIQRDPDTGICYIWMKGESIDNLPKIYKCDYKIDQLWAILNNIESLKAKSPKINLPKLKLIALDNRDKNIKKHHKKLATKKVKVIEAQKKPGKRGRPRKIFQ